MSALTKLKAEVEETKAENRSKLAKARAKLAETRTMSQVAGGVGGLVSSLGCAVVDARKDGDTDKPYACFGETPIPINGTIGAVVATAGVYAAKKHPKLGMFAFVGGVTAIYTNIYAAARDKYQKHLAEQG